MVQARGTPKVFDDANWLSAQLEELVSNHESARIPPWHIADAPADFIAAQKKGIVGVEIPIDSLEGKWKASQNRSEADRQGVIAGLDAEGVCPGMAAIMKQR
jgi:transcriptional regulator